MGNCGTDWSVTKNFSDLLQGSRDLENAWRVRGESVKFFTTGENGHRKFLGRLAENADSVPPAFIELHLDFVLGVTDWPSHGSCFHFQDMDLPSWVLPRSESISIPSGR